MIPGQEARAERHVVESASPGRDVRDGGGSPLSGEPAGFFRIAIERSGHALARLSLFGQLDRRSAGLLARELLRVEGRVRRLILDVRGCSSLDAVGLHILLHARQRAEQGGWELDVVSGGKPLIGRLVRFPEIARRLTLLDTARGALA